jgi:hypothetical protein
MFACVCVCLVCVYVCVCMCVWPVLSERRFVLCVCVCYVVGLLVGVNPPNHHQPTKHHHHQHHQYYQPHQDYPDDLRAKVQDNVKNNRHPLDTAGQKGAISVFIGNLPFSVRVCVVCVGALWLCCVIHAFECLHLATNPPPPPPTHTLSF